MEGNVNLSRRNLLRGKKASTPAPVRLPWTISERVFTAGCTRCEQCISACETEIIIKGSNGYPEIDFSKGECTFCEACVEACELPLFTETTSTPWQLSISLDSNCLANNEVYCQSCRDVCDQSAIKFSYLKTAIPKPEILLDACNSCGACVSTCPQQSIKITTGPN